MRIIMESLFDIAYLVGVFTLGVQILCMANRRDHRLFGILTLVLVCGDAFHLVPRVVGLMSPAGLDGFTAALGIGKLVTSITMTVFYGLLYHYWLIHFSRKENRTVTCAVWVLAAVRIALCLFPQNAWTSADSPVSWGIYRNIPFLILGILIIALFWQTRNKGRRFNRAWLAITLSFLFYIPVVLWADVSPMIGMLMLPKTVCYVWLVSMGWRSARRSVKH